MEGKMDGMAEARRAERRQAAVVDYFEGLAFSPGSIAVWEVDDHTSQENTAFVFFGGSVAAVSEGWRIQESQLRAGRALAYTPGNRIFGSPEDGEACLLVVLVAYGNYEAGDNPAVERAIRETTGSPVSVFTTSTNEHGNIGGYACPIPYSRDTPAALYRRFYGWNYILSVDIVGLDTF